MADVGGKERRIMVAVDESEQSMYALTWCLKNVISHNSNDTLLLLYAKPPRAVYTALDGTGTVFRSGNPVAVGVSGIWFERVLILSGLFFVFLAGYLFSSDIIASVDRYGNDMADLVIEKAKKMCREHTKDVSVFCVFVKKKN